jgi:Fe-S cluster biogenesis protein NfuA
MFIQTEPTPNPATLKFLPGQTVMEMGTANFTATDDAASSPLAQRLFGIEGVVGVFLGGEFITATKTPDGDWETLKAPILSAIMDHYTSGDPMVIESAKLQVPEGADADGEEGGVVSQIKELIETRVRPAVAQDGGDIIFHGFQEGIVYLQMQGACAGCPSSSATLKHGIENMLKYYVPEVLEVRPVE